MNREAIVERLAYIVESTNVDLGGWDGWGRCPCIERADAIAVTREIFDAIEPIIRADERARVVAEATTDEAVIRAILAEQLHYTDLETCDPPVWPDDCGEDPADIIVAMRIAIRAALGSNDHGS